MSYSLTETIKLTPSLASAFGTLETNELTPVIQGDFVYGLNTQVWSTAVTSGTGATVDTNAARLRIQSGTDAAGYAYITSRRTIKYRAGQGVTFRFTPVFGTGVADNIQLWGAGQISSNLPINGYFFGYNGTAFSIFHYNNSSVPTIIPQSTWNGDKCDGSGASGFTYNPLFGSPVMIKYPYLGYGNIFFYIFNPTSSEWILAHAIRYPNTTTTVQLGNPNLQIMGFTLNSGNTTNTTMYCASVGAFVSGTRSFISNPKWAMDSSKTGITAETCLLNLRNATTYNTVTNRSLMRLNSISYGCNANTTSVIVIRFRINATIGGAPSYTTINGTSADGGVTITSGNSVASYDTTGTTSAAGTYLFNMTYVTGNNSGGSGVLDLTPLEIFVAPGEILTISGSASASATIGISVNWTEDV